MSATAASMPASGWPAGAPMLSRSAGPGAAAVLGMLRVAACETPQLEWSAGCGDAQEPVSGVCEFML